MLIIGTTSPPSTMEGNGIVNSLINKLPIEVHIPGGYQYCGPGTNLQKRLSRGDTGINALDTACRDHDIAYSQSADLSRRHEADKLLQERAESRLSDTDASWKEKIAAWGVSKAMKLKRKMGMGVGCRLKKKKIAFGGSLVKDARKSLTRFKRRDGSLMVSPKEGVTIALKAARKALKQAGGKQMIRIPRILPVPKTGGILPLIPIFAGLSALGALAGGASKIAETVKKTQNMQKELDESKRHNKTMEAIAIGSRSGSGLHLKPYRSGLGLYLKQYSKNF